MKDKMEAAERRSEETRKELEELKVETEEYRALKQKTQQPNLTPYVQKQYDNGTYFGEVNEEGQPHGRGLLKWTNGRSYFGEWKNNKRSGKGVEVDEGGIYEGEFLNNRFHGRVVAHLVFKQPEEGMMRTLVYDGEWKDGKKCGKGSALYTNDTVYEGKWESDNFHGQGEMRWVDGSKYKGTYENDERSGYGTHWFPNGDRYEGSWVNNLRHGKGIMKWKDGSIEEGQWVNDLREGQGVAISVKYGHTFEGEYSKDDRKSGVIKWPNGDSWEGHYLEEENREDGERSCEGVMTISKTGNTLKGCWTDYWMKNGKGEMRMWLKEEERELKGEWINGEFHEKKQ